MSIDPGLFERCQAGDATAWRTLFREKAALIHRRAIYLGLRSAEAEEAAQEALAIAAQRIARCDGPEVFDAWLFQITRRVVANARRKAWWRRVITRAEPIEPAFEGPEANPEVELAVRACLERLPRAQAEILILSDLEGRTRDEVASLLGVPAGTAASRLRLARKAFRAIWSAPGAQSAEVETTERAHEV